MRRRSANQRNRGLTFVEMLVVIAALALAVAVLLPALAAARRHGGPGCVSNLKEIGVYFLVWAGDHNGKYPMQTSVTNGGTMEFVGDGRNAWLNYFVMSNELSTPRVLVCPQDARRRPPATNFTSELSDKVSYFVGLDADQSNPKMLLAGDDNLANSGVPVKSGLVLVSTSTGIAWTSARHDRCGNILLADVSVQQLTSNGLQQAILQTGLATNRLAIP